LLDTTKSATAYVHALWTLNGFNAIDFPTLRKALHHPVAGVRENAIKLAELHLQQLPQLENELLSLQNDTAAKVRFRLLCTLGNLNDAQAETVRQKLLVKDIEDKWVQVAALTSSAGREYALIEKTIPAIATHPSEGKKLFFENCAAVIGLSKNVNDIQKLIELAAKNNTRASDWWQSACLKGLVKSINSKGKFQGDFGQQKKLLLSKFNGNASPLMRAAAIDLLLVMGIEKDQAWKSAIDQARSVAANPSADVNFRSDALRLLALEKDNNDEKLLKQIIRPEEPESVQQAALRTYNAISGKDACAFIIHNWKSLTHDVRDVCMDIFLSSVNNMNSLLDALQKNQIQSASISWPRMVELMNNDDLTIRKRAREILAGKTEDRDAVYKKYQAALSKGDANNGLTVFKHVCATCHQVSGEYGRAFGPDLASIRNRDAQSIMADILNPNRSIADKYEMWTVVKKNGEKLSGIIASETSAAIMLHNIGGQQTVIPRSDIKTMEASATSAMPVGLEKSVSTKEMSDLLAFLKNIH
jgi:putative heme-binding domain-containing protein